MYIGQLGYALRCCGDRLEKTEPNVKGHIFCTLGCQPTECSELMFCLSIRRQAEKELNRRAAIDKVLKS